ncbi:chitobiase/beta-hexosaminidase C-terminal domain-containing protein [Flavivirga amylovorans]
MQLFKKAIDGTSFNTINWFVLLLTSFTTVIATIMGLVLSLEGYESELMTWHKWMGVAISFVVFTLILIYKYQKVYKVLLFACLIGVTFAGHYGAGLTHGTHFITEPLVAMNKPKVSENTPIYTGFVQPILDAKCVSCHNPQKKKGELDLSTLAGVKKGGENGSVWLAHQPDESLFLKRVFLPIEDKEHMPPEGKPQLTDSEIKLIQTWIKHGINDTVSLVGLQKTDTLHQIVNNKWLKEVGDKIVQYDFDYADTDVVEALNNPYTTVIQKSHKSPAIDVAIFGKKSFKPEYISDLSKIKEQLVSLNLSNLPVQDSHLNNLSSFENLEVLILNSTQITNDVVKQLLSCKKLKSLSLSDTKVDVKISDDLKKLESLEELYLWNTNMTEEDISSLRAALNDVNIVEGYINDTKEETILAPPVLVDDKNIINSVEKITLKHKMAGVEMYYTLDGSKPDKNSLLYKAPFELNLNGKKSKTIKAKAFKSGWEQSKEAKFVFYDKGLKPVAFEVEYPNIHADYIAHANQILVDEVKPENKVKYSKFWAVFKDKPLIAIADFGNNNVVLSEINLNISVRGKKIKKSPIQFIEVLGSDNKTDWTSLEKKIFLRLNKEKLKSLELAIPKSKSYRYYKVFVKHNPKIELFVGQILFY